MVIVIKGQGEKRTQAQRRAQTRESLLASACRMFGERGYDATSLEDIAEDCGLTIRPVYYHFGSKRDLFLAVNEIVEQRALEALNCDTSIEAWNAFLALCEEPGFRQIILKDASNILSRERWLGMVQLPWAWELTRNTIRQDKIDDEQKEMCARLALAALTEAAIVVMETGNDPATRHDATQLISRLLSDPAPGGELADFSGEETCVSAQASIMNSPCNFKELSKTTGDTINEE